MVVTCLVTLCLNSQSKFRLSLFTDQLAHLLLILHVFVAPPGLWYHDHMTTNLLVVLSITNRLIASASVIVNTSNWLIVMSCGINMNLQYACVHRFSHQHIIPLLVILPCKMPCVGRNKQPILYIYPSIHVQVSIRDKGLFSGKQEMHANHVIHSLLYFWHDVADIRLNVTWMTTLPTVAWWNLGGLQQWSSQWKPFKTIYTTYLFPSW